MRKNVASQNVAAQMNSRSDGSPLTSSVSIFVTIDGGTQSAGGGTLTHKGNGHWNYAPTQAETNGNHIAFTFTHSTGVNQTVNVYTVSFDPHNTVRLGLTALPNAAAEAAGGLYTRGTGAGQINQDANGRIDCNVAAIEAADPTNQIRDSVVDDATRLDGSALNGLDAKVNTIDDFLDTEIAAILAAVDTEIATILTLLDEMRDDGVATFDRATDSLQAIRDRGDAAWTTGGGGSITDLLNVVPLIPESIDLANTASWRLGLMLTNALDDLPTTAEITPGTISIERKPIGGTSWSAVVTDAACSELAGLIYFDEVFDSGTGYAEGDSIRVTFKSQKITVAANDYEITDSNGRIFYTEIRQTERGTNSAALASVCTEARLAELDAGNLPADVAAVFAAVDSEVAAILAAVDTEVAAIKAQTDQLAFTGGNVHARAQAVANDAIAAAAVAADVGTELANAILDLANGVETGFTLRQALRLLLAALAGKLSGAATTTIAIRDVNDTKTRITGTVDADGNRTAVIYDTT